MGPGKVLPSAALATLLGASAVSAYDVTIGTASATYVGVEFSSDVTVGLDPTVTAKAGAPEVFLVDFKGTDLANLVIEGTSDTPIEFGMLLRVAGLSLTQGSLIVKNNLPKMSRTIVSSLKSEQRYSSEPVVRLEGTNFQTNTSFALTDATVSFANFAATNTVLDITVPSLSIADVSAVQMSGTSAGNVAHLLKTAGEVSVSDNSILSVSNFAVKGASASGELVSVGGPLTVKDASMFRVSGLSVEGAGPLLGVAGAVSVSGQSTFAVTDSSIGAGKLLKLSDPTFVVTDNSVASFVGLVVGGTGVEPVAPGIPSSRTDTSKVYGGTVTVGSTQLGTIKDFADNGLIVTDLVNKDGVVVEGTDKDKCSLWQCNQANTILPATGNTNCGACPCKEGFQQPFCTTGVDADGDTDVTSSCGLQFCTQCDTKGACTACIGGFQPSADGSKCESVGTTQTIAPTTSTTRDPSAPSCNIANCARCVLVGGKPYCESCALSYITTSDGKCVMQCLVDFCAQCRDGDAYTCLHCNQGFTPRGGQCFPNDAARRAAPSAVAGLVLLATVVASYVL